MPKLKNNKEETKRGYKFYTYFTEEEMKLVKKYSYEHFGLNEVNSATARIIVIRLLKDAGYALPEPE